MLIIVPKLCNDKSMLNKIFCYYPVMLALKTVKQQVFLEFEKMRSLFELEGNYAFQKRAKQSALLYHLLF